MLLLKDCFKACSFDLDKARPPQETVVRVREIFSRYGADILADIRRIDSGRLGIPVYMSLCGSRAREVMPTRKQMGKGASAIQAEASALMELAERFSYFTFWADESRFEHLTWSQARRRFGAELVPIGHLLRSVNDSLHPGEAEAILDLITWRFHPATDLTTEKTRQVPLDWFKLLNEFNGSCAGNTPEEALLQGACELVERHVSAVVDRSRPTLPSLDPATFADPKLSELYACFTRNNIRVWLKDFSLGMPVPTVGAVAYDPRNFPGLSEIVYTAGTAASPAKAAVRALTEVAQLAGDFETASNFEASGLSKYTSLDQIEWLKAGPLIDLADLPDISSDNILVELRRLASRLADMDFPLYAADITHPDLGLPSYYTFAPGMLFRERTPNASLGLMVGRLLAENAPPKEAMEKLDTIEKYYPNGHFLPFHRGLVVQRMGDNGTARDFFIRAIDLQPSAEEASLAAFYAGYSLTCAQEWAEALPLLRHAVELDSGSNAAWNLLGVSLFKLERYEEAARAFQRAVEIDGSAAIDYANLGMCSLRMGNRNAARDFFELALSIDPNIVFARKELAGIEAALSGKRRIDKGPSGL